MVNRPLPSPTPRATIKAHPTTLHRARPYGIIEWEALKASHSVWMGFGVLGSGSRYGCGECC